MNNKKKSMVLTTLAIFFIGVGFFGFRSEKNNFDIAIDNNEKSGDVQLVSSNSVEVVDEEEVTKKENDDYFSETRIDREKRYSQMIESYQKIVDSNQISSEQKGIAIEEIKKIENQKNGILVAENLIKNKGFKDVVILISENSISVIIKSNVSFLPEQIAQIQNIVSRELNSKIENINISNK